MLIHDTHLLFQYLYDFSRFVRCVLSTSLCTVNVADISRDSRRPRRDLASILCVLVLPCPKSNSSTAVSKQQANGPHLRPQSASCYAFKSPRTQRSACNILEYDLPTTTVDPSFCSVLTWNLYSNLRTKSIPRAYTTLSSLTHAVIWQSYETSSSQTSIYRTSWSLHHLSSQTKSPLHEPIHGWARLTAKRPLT